MIARTWRGAVRTDDAAAYARYLETAGKPACLGTPGNHGFAVLSRPAGERTVILTISLWESLESIRGFAGDDVERAVFFPEDDAFLVERDLHVDHWQVDEASFIEGLGQRA